MANSPLVSIRIPPEMLKRVDELAQKMYPSRRAGKNPNRSQVILDAIAQFLEQHESSLANTPDINEQPINKIPDQQFDDELITKALQEYVKDTEPLHLEYPKPKDVPIREYINWWNDYFSYMRKLTDIWFGAK